MGCFDFVIGCVEDVLMWVLGFIEVGFRVDSLDSRKHAFTKEARQGVLVKRSALTQHGAI